MSAGTVVVDPSGNEVVLGEIGQAVLVENERVRVWEVALAPGEWQPWHLHHHPYLVLCLQSSPCRMDWLDGSAPRHIEETVGGVVSRPTSPVHMLTNTGDRPYRNRIIELLDLGQEGARPRPGAEPPPSGGVAPGRVGQEIVHEDDQVRVWSIELPPGAHQPWHTHHHPYVVVTLAGAQNRIDPARRGEPRHVTVETGGVAYRAAGETHMLTNLGATTYRSRLVELRYLGENRTAP